MSLFGDPKLNERFVMAAESIARSLERATTAAPPVNVLEQAKSILAQFRDDFPRTGDPWGKPSAHPGEPSDRR